jgi:lysozyme
MSWLDKADELIDEWESCELKAYKCPAGIWTIGWGSTGHDIISGTVWTQEQADTRRDIMVQDIGQCIDRHAGKLNDNQKAALVCFVYNIGQGAFISSTMLRLLKVCDFEGAALQFVRWDKLHSGEVCEGLANRRHAEMRLFTQPL